MGNFEHFRGLDGDFMEALLDGKLNAILQFERKHRKSFMVEIRNNFLDLYFLGHSIEVKGTNKTGYYLSASETFNPKKLLSGGLKKSITSSGYGKWQLFFDDVKNNDQFEELMNAVISRIITHRRGDISEGVSEINHFIDNRAIGKNGILVIDRQVVYPGIRESRIDLLGLTRIDRNKDLFTFAVIELKNKNNTEIGKVFTQTKRYIDLLTKNKQVYDRFKLTYEKVLRQKVKLGLLKRISCKIAEWSEISQKDIQGIVILDNFNIKSDIRQNGLLQRAIKDWETSNLQYNTKLFIKTNVLDPTFFIDLNNAKKLLKVYRECNL